MPVPRSSAINRDVMMPVTAGKSPQKSTPATSAHSGLSAPPSIICIGYSTPRGPFSVSNPSARLNNKPVSTRKLNRAT